ncbi:MAG: outer membrane protein assembly factor [Balneolia bacterium]|nr:outer membrane protein assembly factor [Balneolia bacterium]
MSSVAAAEAQSQDDEIRQGLLPTLSYSTDSGMGVGGLYQFHQLNGGDRIKRLYRVSGNIYLNEGFSARTSLEERFTDVHRLTVTAEARQMTSAYFFGRGGSTVFNEGDFNKYSRLFMDLSGEYGVRLGDSGAASRVELTAGARIGYIENYDIDDTLLEDLSPRGYEGGFRQSFSIGLMGDFRNDVFRPTTGHTFALGVEFFPSQLGNEMSLGKLRGSVSAYQQFYFITDVVVAARFSGEQILARSPYYELSTLGGEHTLRGYVLERFRDYGSMVANLELRTWLFEIPALRMEVGGQLFTDAGALYVHPFELDWIHNIKATAGLGGAVALFNRDFIIRGDLGFSNESWRLYTGIGYMF